MARVVDLGDGRGPGGSTKIRGQTAAIQKRSDGGGLYKRLVEEVAESEGGGE